MVMKKVLYMLSLAWITFGMASCEKEVKDYDGGKVFISSYNTVRHGVIPRFGPVTPLLRWNS